MFVIFVDFIFDQRLLRKLGDVVDKSVKPCGFDFKCLVGSSQADVVLFRREVTSAVSHRG